MIRYFTVLFVLLFVPLSVSSVFGTVEDFTTDKNFYFENETLIVSGIVLSETKNPDVLVMVFAPGKSTIITVAPTTANSNGEFSVSIHVGGPTWISYGNYPIQVTSENHSLEKSLEYKKSSTTTPESEPTPTSEPTPASEPTPTSEPTPVSSSAFTTLKLQIPNFPSLDKSPQFYIDRYNNEPSYKSWFDSQFPFNSITDVVGYKLTSLDSFPSLDKSPQFYLDRYNNEPSYKSWFDSQFLGVSIYNILGYEDPISVPDWIRNNAEWWATGTITDSTFVTGIEFMLENNIIMISNIPSGNVPGDEIPNWIRNNAHWWSQDLISEDEFVNSLKFLIQEGIIVIN